MALMVHAMDHTQHHNYTQLPTSLPEVDWRWKSPLDERGQSRSDLESGEDSEQQQKKRRLAELKTTVFDTYAICAALLASFACSTAYISEKELLLEAPLRRYTVQFQQILVRVCIIGGIHAMLVFMFCALYAKSALARENYGLEVYEKFSKETGGTRQMAFWSMYYTTILYCFQIALSTVYSLPMIPAWICSAALMALIMRVVWDAQSVIKSAGCVFMSGEQVRIMLEEEAAGL